MIDWDKIERVRAELKLSVDTTFDDQFLIDVLYFSAAIEELRTELQMVQDERNWLRRQLDKK